MNQCSAPGARTELLWRRTILCERQIENAAALLPSAHFFAASARSGQAKWMSNRFTAKVLVSSNRRLWHLRNDLRRNTRLVAA
jgi:hypothetical protein